MAWQEEFPGTRREVRERRFGEILDENPRNLAFLAGQYYWAQDLV